VKATKQLQQLLRQKEPQLQEAQEHKAHDTDHDVVSQHTSDAARCNAAVSRADSVPRFSLHFDIASMRCSDS
jgi:hypothetical protein